MGSNEISQIEEFHSKETLFGNIAKPVLNPSILLGKGSGRLCLINKGLQRHTIHVMNAQLLFLLEFQESTCAPLPWYMHSETVSNLSNTPMHGLLISMHAFHAFNNHMNRIYGYKASQSNEK